MSLNLSISCSESLINFRKLLEAKRNDFLYNFKDPDHFTIRSIVYDSWVRCLQSGIDPGRKLTEEPLQTAKIKDIIKSSKLYEYSINTLKELLIQIQNTDHVLTLNDSQGRIIFLGGDRHVQKQAEKINFVLGSRWCEEAIGTNAIGTSLKTGNPVQIFTAEHYCEGIHDWVCSSSPIRDPITKEVLGVIDVTGIWKNAQSHTLGMVMMASQVIEQKLYEQAVLARLQLIERFLSLNRRYPQNGVIVLNKGFSPLEANQYARNYIHEMTGQNLEIIWNEQEIKAHIEQHHNSWQQKKEYEVFLKQIGIPVLIQEIYHYETLIGFGLIISSSNQKTSTKLLNRENTPWSKVIGTSNKIHTAMSQCNIVAHASVPVLLFGESGSGKELFARAIHQISDRRKGPFVAINCGAVPKELLASELFGYDPGTFTGAIKGGRKGKFEEAHKGTIFLDEIGEMPLDFQIHLLRVLQEREVVRLGGAMPIPVDVKIIAATHQNLEQLVNDGLFRADCFYRLHVISINIPSLRERRDDIPQLIDHFLNQFAQKYHKQLPKLNKQISDFLINIYQWPGNVRELQSCLEHAVLFCVNSIIMKDDLPQTIQKALHSQRTPANVLDAACKESLSCQKKEDLLKILHESGGNLSAAARRLGIARTTLYRHLNKYGVKKSSTSLYKEIPPHTFHGTEHEL